MSKAWQPRLRRSRSHRDPNADHAIVGRAKSMRVVRDPLIPAERKKRDREREREGWQLPKPPEQSKATLRKQETLTLNTISKITLLCVFVTVGRKLSTLRP